MFASRTTMLVLHWRTRLRVRHVRVRTVARCPRVELAGKGLRVVDNKREISLAEEHLERVVSLSTDVLERLRHGARVSEVLSDISLIAAMQGDQWVEELVSLLAYGYERHTAMQAKGVVRRASRKAMETWLSLVAVADVRRVDLEKTAEEGLQVEDIKRTQVLTESVSISEQCELEDAGSPPHQADNHEPSNWAHYNALFRSERQGVLYRVRSYLSNYVQQVWQESTREQQRIRLLGIDYRVAITNLDSLPGELGAQLLAAGDNLRSSNPHSWQLCLLGCRNVVLALGRELGPSDPGQYTLLCGRSIEVGPTHEKNGLRAYLDKKARETASMKSIARMATEADKLTTRVYDGGSAGKSGAGEYDKAKKVLLETYALVRILRSLGAFPGTSP